MTEIKFRGKSLEGGIFEGDLIHVEKSPFIYIQNRKGGNIPVVQNSVEIMIGDKWIPISDLERMKAHTFEETDVLLFKNEIRKIQESYSCDDEMMDEVGDFIDSVFDTKNQPNKFGIDFVKPITIGGETFIPSRELGLHWDDYEVRRWIRDKTAWNFPQIKQMERWHFNIYSLPETDYIKVTEDNNPYK